MRSRIVRVRLTVHDRGGPLPRRGVRRPACPAPAAKIPPSTWSSHETREDDRGATIVREYETHCRESYEQHTAGISAYKNARENISREEPGSVKNKNVTAHGNFFSQTIIKCTMTKISGGGRTWIVNTSYGCPYRCLLLVYYFRFQSTIYEAIDWIFFRGEEGSLFLFISFSFLRLIAIAFSLIVWNVP